DAAREGYGAGVRAVFEAGSRLAGVRGTVADLLDVPPGLERAVEAVLGERLQWVVVDRFEHARAAVEYLATRRAGAATFVPLEHLRNGGSRGAPPISPHDEAANPALAWVARAIGGPAPSLVHHLLGQVAVVRHLDAAEALWRRNGVVATYVTRAGEVLSPAGALTGGRRDGERHVNEQSLLGRKRAIRQLADEVGALGRNVEESQQRLHALEVAVDSLRARQGMLQVSVHAQETARLSGGKDLEATRRESERVIRHLETLEAEARLVSAESVETDGELTSLEGRLSDIEARESSLEREMTTLRERLEVDQA